MTKEDLQQISDLMEKQKSEINDLMDAKLSPISLVIENEIRPQLKALAEGQHTILAKLDELTPKTKTEQLEDQIEMMKSVIKLHTIEIAELKKAQ